MRAVVLALGLAATFVYGASAPAEARPMLPWCAFMNDTQTTECFYWSLAQCRATIFGVGGMCSPNPFYVEPPVRKSHKRYRDRY